MADDYIFQNTLENDIDFSSFLKKEIVQIYDTNGSNYTNQIRFDMTSLATVNKWADYQNALLEIPFTISLQSSQDATAAGVINSFMCGLKNGNHQLIDNLQVQYNNNTVVQQTSFTNLYVSYKLMSTWSKDDLAKWGPVCNFSPDTAGSAVYQAAASLDGIGICHNRVIETQPIFAVPSAGTGNTFTLTTANQGFLDRLKMNAYDLSTTAVALLTGAGYGAIPSTNSASACQNIGKSYLSDNTLGTTDRIWKFNLLCTIRLRDVCSFFETIPLIKGGRMLMNVNFNAGRVVIPMTAGSDIFGLTSSTIIAGNCLPFMVASGGGSQPCDAYGNIANNSVLTIEGNVYQTKIPAAQNDLLSNCRLFIPVYTMNPVKEDELLGIRKIRDVEYTDIMSYSFDVSSNANFNQVVTNGLRDIKRVIVIPQLKKVEGNDVTVPYTSPFDSSPATTCPLASLRNFNILVAGSNLFNNNVDYDFDMFCNEIAPAYALNGGYSQVLTSGLLDRFSWDNNYRYYVGDVSRRLNSDKDVSLSVSIQGVNNSGVGLKLFVFVEYGCSYKLNLETSAMTELRN